MKTFPNFFLLGALSFIAPKLEAQTHITVLPYAITSPGVYVLNSSLTYTRHGAGETANAIAIRASGVVLDFRGYSISNLVAGPDTEATCIKVYGSEVIIQHGKILGFEFGIETVSNTVIQDMRFAYQTRDTIVIDGSKGAVIQNCEISNTGYTPSGTVVNRHYTCAGIESVYSGGTNSILHNTVLHVAGVGIYGSGGDIVFHDYVANSIIGIQIGNAPTTTCLDNTIRQTTTPFSFAQL